MLMITSRWIIFLVILLNAQISAAQSPLQPDRLTCEYIVNPLGIDIHSPQFSWTFRTSGFNQYQSAYEIIITDNHDDAQVLKGDIWSTGKIKSKQNTNISYQGSPLKSFTRYYWRVKVYNQDDKASDWSEVNWFETAMLQQSDWKAKWISDGSQPPAKDEDAYEPDPMPLFRKEFTAEKKVTSARLYISGLGYYEAFLNGKKISDHVLDPGWTTYRKQVLYVVHDVTSLIASGKNVAGIMLGNGWWNPLPFKFFGRWDLRDYQQTGRPCVKAEFHLTYNDGSKQIIPTDETWQTAPGPIVKNNVYLGEHYDARLEVKNWNAAGKLSGNWKPAVLVDGPSGIMSAQMQPPVRITRVLKPISITQTGKDTFIVDMGQNFAGVVRLKVRGQAGRKVTMRLGEGLFKDGSINLMTAVATQIKKGGIKGGPGAPETAWQEDSYTLKGEGTETWAPRFTFHGFQYVEVTGWPGKPTIENFEGLRMNSDLPLQGEFSCSNPMFNKLHDVIQWTFMSNVFSVQSDCPGREKMGYGADMVVSANAFIYNYDMRNFYRKAVRDFANEQRPQGGITEIAPFTGIADRGYGDDSGPMGWQLGFPFLQKQLYDSYGDKRVIEEYYDECQRQMAFLKSKEENGLFHWDISDHEALDPRPEALSASSWYYHHALLAAEFAGILDKADDSVKYAKLAANIKRLIVRKYLVPGTGRFDNGTQSAQLFALNYKLLPEEDLTYKALLSEFERHNWHVSSGIFGVKMMFDVLRERNENELAYKIANQKDFPGWGYMLQNGATTLWESWEFPETSPSRNHPMFGSIDEWFYRSLLGINPGAPGFEKIIIKPQPAADLTYASGKYESVKGTIASDWKIADRKFNLNVTIPANTTAEVWLPSKAGDVTLNGRNANDASTVRLLKTENGYSVFACGSGNFQFVSNY
jgi:alpha-L-rhamnosidase